jgi:hypothetical protein
MRRYSDVCRKLQDDRDDLFSLFSHEQRAARDLTQELAAAREELARVKDDLEFARRAIKALQSSKTTSKEALCAIYLKAPHPSPLLPSPPCLLLPTSSSPRPCLPASLLDFVYVRWQVLQRLCACSAEDRVVGRREICKRQVARSIG